VRLGKKEEDKKRPLLVKLDSGVTKFRILRNSAKLKDADVRYQGIGLEHDYTPIQKEDRRKLLAKAREMTLEDQSGNYVYRIRGPPGNLKIKKISKIQ